jgi:localization factor PodJL
MSSSVPWSVKGIDRKARETAKDLARRSGMTLGEWLNHVIEYQGEGKVTPLPANATLNETIEQLTKRIESVETRSTLAVTGIDNSVRGLAARLDAGDRLPEAGTGELRVAEALKALESSIGRIAAQVYENEAAQKASLAEMRDELGLLTRRIDSVEMGGAGAAADGGAIAQRLEAMSQQIQHAEQRSSQAIERIGHEVLRMADTVTRQVQGVEARTEAAVGKIGGDVARITGQLESQLRQADAAQAQALEKLGAEIERITQKLTERVSEAERRSAQAIDTLRAEADADPFAVEPAFGLAERIRQSEERTAVLLEEAREVIDQRLAETAGQAPEPFDVEADTDFDPFGLEDEPNPFDAAAARLSAYGVEPSAPVVYPDMDPARSDYAFAPQDFQIVGAEATAQEEAHEQEAKDDLEAFADVQIEAVDPFAPADPFTVDPFETTDESVAEDPFAEAETDEFAAAKAETDEFVIAAQAEPAFDPAFEAVDEAEAFNPGPFSRREDAAAQPDDLAPIESLFADDTGEDEFVGVAEPGPEAPVSRMEFLERAREAARRAATEKGGDKRGRGGSGVGGFALGAKRRGGVKLKNGLLMSTALLICLGAGMSGVAILAPMLKEQDKAKLAAAAGGKTLDLQPRAAMMTTPQPIPGKGTAPASAAVTPLVPPPAAPAAPAAKPDAPDASLIYAESLSLLAAKDKRGMEMLKRAADLGYPQAELQLGHLYETGYPGLNRDLAEARKWTQKAAEAGLPSAMHNLAMLIYNGEGGPKSQTLAAQWFRQAAELGLADSQFNLGLLYENGKGVRANPAEAYKWFLLAGRGGDPASRAEARAAAQRVRPLLSAEAQGAAERAATAYGAPMQASR